MKNLMSKTIATSRPVSWINTAYPFAATYFFISHDFDWYLIIGTLFFLFPYNLFMYGINDVFDYESDKNNPRKDSIEGAVLEKSIHKQILINILLINIPFIIALLLLSNLESALMLIFVVFMAFAYSAPPFRFKEIPILDSVTSSSHFVGPMLVALAYLGYIEQAIPIIFAFFLWGFASHAFGAIQDIIPDRQAKIASIATYFGAKTTLNICIAFYTVSSMILLFYLPETVAPGIVGLAYIANCLDFIDVNDKTSASVNKGWRRFIYLNLIMGFVITIVLILNF